MSLEAALYDILKAASAVTDLIGGARSPRIYPLGIPQGKTGAAVVYQLLSSPDEVTCDGQLGQPEPHWQITCWSAQGGTPDDARALAEAVYKALTAPQAAGNHGGTEVRYWISEDERHTADVNEQDESLTRYGIQQDWQVSYSR